MAHEWTYEALAYDCLPVEPPNTVRYAAESQSGREEAREHRLDDSTDETWAEFRHQHVADVFAALAARFKDFQSRNRAAKYQVGGGGERSE